MNSTASGSETSKKETLRFINGLHEVFYNEKLKEVRYQDECHKALCYCLGICDETRKNFNQIYDIKTGCVNPECLHKGWQTSGSAKVVRMAFNLYCNGIPSLHLHNNLIDQFAECEEYSVENLFACGYAPYFWQAVQIRYPEYTGFEV